MVKEADTSGESSTRVATSESLGDAFQINADSECRYVEDSLASDSVCDFKADVEPTETTDASVSSDAGTVLTPVDGEPAVDGLEDESAVGALTHSEPSAMELQAMFTPMVRSWCGLVGLLTIAVLGSWAWQELPVRKYSSVQPEFKVDLNSASQAELKALPEVGPQLAARIIEYRRQSPFRRHEDLLNVFGVGERTLEQLRPLLADISLTETTSFHDSRDVYVGAESAAETPAKVQTPERE